MTKRQIDKSLNHIACDVKDSIYYMKDFAEKIKQQAPQLLIDLYDFCLDSYVEEQKKEKKLYCPYCKTVYDWDDWQWDSELKCKEGHVLPVRTDISCNDDYFVGFDSEEKPVLMTKFSCDKSNKDYIEKEKRKVRRLVDEKEEMEKMEEDLKVIDEIAKEVSLADKQIEAGWHI